MSAASPRLLRVLLALVALSIVVKAASADLTWDESWTFLHYGRHAFGWTAFDYANDHVANSIAVWASTSLFGASPFAIRLPNVLAGLLYLAATGRLLAATRARGVAVALCVLNPYLIEHFALARGYGLAAALLQWGLVRDWVAGPAQAERGPSRALAAAVCASYAIASDVTIVLALGVVSLVRARRGVVRARSDGGVRRAIVVVGCAGIAAVPAFAIGWHETRPGVPVFGSDAGPFGAIAGGVARMWVGRRQAPTVAALGLCALAIALFAVRRHASPRTRALLGASAVELVLLIVGSALFGRRLPTDRLLVPSLPLWNLAAVAVVEDLGAVAATRMRAVGAVLLFCCGVCFVARLRTERYVDWAPDAGIAARTARAEAQGGHCLPRDVWDRYGHAYYVWRWFGDAGGPVPDVPCPAPRVGTIARNANKA